MVLVLSAGACSDGTGPVPPSIDRFLSIVPGGGLTCGVGVDSAAYCWGQNDALQAGSPTSARCLDGGLNPVACAKWPQRVPVEGTVAKVTTGSHHACALTDDGVAWCWGGNWAGQLGGGTASARRGAARVSLTATLVDLHAGPEHTCALDTTGVVWCWGMNDYGQLGRGTSDMDPHPVPAPIVSDLRFAAIARGFSQTTCALTSAGVTYCWGPNDGGMPPGLGVLGDTARDECLANPFLRFGTQCNMTPKRAMPDLVFDDVSVGIVHACGLTGGEWICWGVALGGAHGIGQPQDCMLTGNGIEYHFDCNRDRVPVIGGDAFTTVGAGGGWSCGLDGSGQGWCWGSNAWGWLGTGINEHTSDVPVAIAGSLTLASLEVGSAHACGLVANGNAYCWGYARTGAIGDGTYSEQPALAPRRVVARP